MDLLSSFLAKYKNLKPADDFKKETVKDIIFKIVGLEIDKKNISVVNQVIYLNISPKAKAEIYMNKNRIIKELSEILDKAAPKDIR